VDKFLSFSTFPLRFLAILGLIGIIASTSLGIYYFVRYLIGGIRVVGWITQTLLLIALSGFNFFAFGIIGEYLLRILQSTHNTPQFLIRQKVGKYKPILESMSNGKEVQPINSTEESGIQSISTQHDQ
jgi:dolichol-phosphate mannosyltransferase/undecaprenyl-phosphate 4-deoxy-4-formamido-L-arabinose transferase